MIENTRTREQTFESNGHTLAVHQMQVQLRSWGEHHRRSFQGRETRDAFHLLVASLMLRRTRAEQVVPVFLECIQRYPDVRTLALAPPAEVAHLLFPLGLALRVSAFQNMAQILLECHNSSVPSDDETLLTLPGVGEYVISAVCCFARGQALPIIDTNTVRVAGRLFALPTHAESRRKLPVRLILSTLLAKEQPVVYKSALLDLAALICAPAHPCCAICPLVQCCATGQLRQKSLVEMYEKE
jgi:A/G-specific adenine glycosylase